MCSTLFVRYSRNWPIGPGANQRGFVSLALWYCTRVPGMKGKSVEHPPRQLQPQRLKFQLS